MPMMKTVSQDLAETSLDDDTAAAPLVPDTAHRRFDVLGVPVSALDLPRAVTIIEDWVQREARTFVCITGVHGVIECRDDPELLAIHRRAGMVTTDGMPLVWWAHRTGLADVGRVYGPDLMRSLCSRAQENGFRHFFYGGGGGVAEALRRTLVDQNPYLRVVGTFEPPFRPLNEEESARVVEMINLAMPDIVWVGLSTPKQECWMNEYRDRLDAPVLIGVGAAFDFLAGRQRQAPVVIQRSGFEWLYRLVHEPRRLWKRYSRIVPRFVLLAVRQSLRGRR